VIAPVLATGLPNVLLLIVELISVGELPVSTRPKSSTVTGDCVGTPCRNTLTVPLMVAVVVTALLSVFVTCHPWLGPAVSPDWMEPVTACPTPGAMVEPLPGVKLFTASEPVDERPTTRSAEPVGAVLVSVALKGMLVLTKASTGDEGAE
jgi:hypothetical protein